MFVDSAKVNISAGKGGSGVVSFRHEIYVEKGGPDGGDGGNGGNVVFRASYNQNTLANFRFNKTLKAQDGQNGSKAKKHGKNGQDLIVEVPVGTVLLNADKQVLYDLSQDMQQVVVAHGGKGGFGNAHFKSSVRQAPRVAEKGEAGDELECQLELRMIADVGLVGLPNAGKSSFLAAVSNARPQIANYPFTTLKPHLGVVDIYDNSLLIADIPGLIKGASEGKGLGDEFLKHIARCSVLLHLVDVTSDDVVTDYLTIRQELSTYSVDLAQKVEVVALSKCDIATDNEVQTKLRLLKKNLINSNAEVFKISSYSKAELSTLVVKLYTLVSEYKKALPVINPESASDIKVYKLKNTDDAWKVVKTKQGFVVIGKKIEKFAERTNFENDHALSRIRDIMKKMGILRYLTKQGINPGDKIIIGDPKRGEVEY